MPTKPTAAPVFVDPTGRRRRTVRLTAVIGVGVLFAVCGLVVAALLGAPIMPTASLPDRAPANEAPPRPAKAPDTTQSPDSSPDQPAPEADPTTAAETTEPSGNPTTTTAKGNKPDQPPGRPTDRPVPPGRTR
jgi:hypothetical protein